MKKCNLEAMKKQMKRDLKNLERNLEHAVCEAISYEELVNGRKIKEREWGMIGIDYLEMTQAYCEMIDLLIEYVNEIKIKRGE